MRSDLLFKGKLQVWLKAVSQIDDVLVSELINLNRFHTLLWCFIVDFEQVNAGW